MRDILPNPDDAPEGAAPWDVSRPLLRLGASATRLAAVHLGRRTTVDLGAVGLLVERLVLVDPLRVRRLLLERLAHLRLQVLVRHGGLLRAGMEHPLCHPAGARVDRAGLSSRRPGSRGGRSPRRWTAPRPTRCRG